MVSIIQHQEKLYDYQSDVYLKTLFDFINGKEIICEVSQPTNANEIAIATLYSIQTNNKKNFIKVYENIQLRTPKADSDWIYNDLLLFSLTIGITHFSVDNSWLMNVLRIRFTHTQEENATITQTYFDVLKNNFDSTNNFHPLLLVFKHCLKIPINDENYLNHLYKELIQTIPIKTKSPFIQTINDCAFNIIVLYKGVIDINNREKIMTFIVTFDKRTTSFAFILWFLVLFFIFIITFIFVFYYISIPDQNKIIINDFFTALQVLGVSGIITPIIKKRNAIIDFFKKPVNWFFKFQIDLNKIK